MKLERLGTRVAAALTAAAIAAAMAAGAAPASASHPTLHVAKRHVTYGQQLAISGSAASHAALAVQESVFPFSAGFRTITVVHAGANGSYTVRIRPKLATRIRVVAGSARSTTVTVYVFPRDKSSCNLCRLTNTAGSHTLALTDVFTSVPGPVLGPEYVYYALSNSPVAPSQLRLVETVALRQIAPGAFEGVASYQVHFPSGPFRFVYETCTRELEAQDGLGLPGTPHCGDPTLLASELSNAAYIN